MNMQNSIIFQVKKLLSKLKEMNIEVTNHMATIEADAMKKLDGIYKKRK